MEILIYIFKISFLISIIFVLYKLYSFFKVSKLTIAKAFLINIALMNLLWFLVFLWAFLSEITPLTINNNINSFKFIYDTITYFVQWSVPISFFVFIYLIFKRKPSKFQYRDLLVPAILVVAPKVAVWIEILIFETNYLLHNLYATTDLLIIIAMILASIYLKYRASQLSKNKINISINHLSLIYFIPYLIAFILTIIFRLIKIPIELSTIINLSLIIIFNLGIALWINKYRQVFVQHYIELEVKTSSKLEMFMSNYEITVRELDVIKLICNGKTNKEIADQLFISISTVKDHNYNIYQKLSIKNRTQLMKLYFEFQDNLQ